jgi:hypothetical protein
MDVDSGGIWSAKRGASYTVGEMSTINFVMFQYQAVGNAPAHAL